MSMKNKRLLHSAKKSDEKVVLKVVQPKPPMWPQEAAPARERSSGEFLGFNQLVETWHSLRKSS